MKKTVKKINFKILLLIFISLILVFSCYFLVNIFFINKNDKELINITSLSDEFIDNYLENIKSSTKEEKENMLIVISNYEIKDTYGANKVIDAPNNQYILQYDSKKDRENALKKLKENKKIVSVEENGIYKTNDVSYNSWGIEKMSLDYAINTANTYNNIMESVNVAIIDTGCDMTLFNKYYSGKITEFYNVLENSTIVMTDEDGHGTHIAGTIAEGTPNNVKIIPLKVSTDGNMYYSDIIAAINYIVHYNKADVINMSFGGYGYNQALYQAIEAAKQNNIISVAAAGNDNTSEKSYPASQDNTISVSSVDSLLNKSYFSNYGSDITFTAPGTLIKSIMGNNTLISLENGNSDGDDDHETISGTSMATPHVVNAIAILKGYNKNLTLDNVIDILKENTIDLGEEGWDQYYGYGLISFENVQFCDGTYCDTYHVFKDLSKNITSINATNLNLTQYNYYSITNLLGSKVSVTYSDSTTEEIAIGNLPNVEISNYDPLATGNQTITIKIGTLSTTINVTNPDNYESGWEYNDLSDGKIEITGYNNHELEIEKLYVPEYIDSKQVVSFSDNFKFSESGADIEHYTYLYLPSSFARIGSYSMANTNIKYVYGTSDIEIGSHAFEDGSIIVIENPIIKVEEYAFKNCYELSTIDLPGIFKNVSSSNSQISEVEIEQYAFYNCKKLANVTKSKYDYVYINEIGKYAFYNCVSLSSFNLLPNCDIGEYAFYNTLLLNNIDLYNSNSIGKYAFYNSGISEASFSISLNIIDDSAFENCKNLKEVSIVVGRIETKSFWNSGVEQIYIGNLVTYISEDSFAYSPIKACDGSSDGNTYKVVSSVGIIEKSTNKLIVGFTDFIGISNTNIPNYITEIGNYAFTGNNTLEVITIPSTVTKIGTHSFEDCYQLSNVYMLNSSITLGNDSFKRNYEGEIEENELIFYVYKNSSAKQYAIDNQISYRHFDPDSYEVINLKESYLAGSYLTGDNILKVKLIYNEAETREELITQEDPNINGPVSTGRTLTVEYQNPNSGFNYGDTYITITVKTPLGYEVCSNVQVPVTIIKATPTYTIPQNLTGHLFQKLSDIELPNGFSWMNEETELTTIGSNTYKVKYTPSDTNNYEIVENIDVTVLVDDIRELIIPNIQVSNKTYDGTNVIPFEKISISNLEINEYTIISAVSSSIQAGSTTATIKIKLSDEKFKHYYFEGKLQEKEFTANINIENSGNIYTSSDFETIYDGVEHTININFNIQNYSIKYSLDNINYNLDVLPKFKDVGEHIIYYKILADGYEDISSSNKVKIYGIKDFDSSITVKNNILVISNKSFVNLKNKLNTYSISKEITHLDSNNISVDTDNIKTGDSIKININNSKNYSYKLAYLGDVNGDGNVGIIDYIRIMKDIMGTSSLSDVYYEAADMNRNGSIDIIDYIRIMKIIMEEK